MSLTEQEVAKRFQRGEPTVETVADRQEAQDRAEGITCSCWSYEPKPTCEDRNSVRHYWAW